ncbi:GerAB/ArcD/ProY family transporter [Anaeromicrobium sediminis]|uniref:Uncharacterized protein n=1 Tax=Anaeromicrobium sediminis TaxID=1478221 RepID=A0A267MHY1_9FIRM|nr:GerAB/ArcD/ProY family transporter [Anaeromicrobium sediminis]PAB59136.1 hypothetical protein CCE28_11500 [Anaeromicrobium sediminis]
MRKNKITQNQYIFIVISSMIGVGILSVASDLCKVAYQQGWISIFIGGLYPACIVITAAIIDNKTNHASFFHVNNKIYGKILSRIFTLIFLLYFLTIFVAIISGFTNILRETITRFLAPTYIILPIFILIPLISMCGIYIVGRICEFYFYLTIPLIVIPLFFITKGSIINIKPIFSSFDEILKSTPTGIYAFSGCEISYLIISKISNNSNTKKAGIMAASITTCIYSFGVFITIYYLGWELTSKLEYPLLYLIQAMNIPIISNFTALFLFLWSLIILRTLICISFACGDFFSELIKINYRKANFIFLAIALVYVFFMIPEYNRDMFLGKVIPYFVIFSFAWGLVTTILVVIKFRGGKNESFKKDKS